jgi:ATP-dependent exoDNAse (exonuclease V) alpha subunit
MNGSRILPSAHLSARVPWHDRAWNGTTCAVPAANTHCIVLKRIGASRDDTAETIHAGEAWDTEGRWLPPCAAERGGFMAASSHTRFVEHPYAERHKLFAHFGGTHLHHPAYCVSAVPFAWMIKDGKPWDGLPTRAERLMLDYQPEIEPRIRDDRPDTWIQHGHNQKIMLDTFFSAIRPQESLVFLYAKRTPITDNPNRVIVGIGRVTGLGRAVAHNHRDGTPKGAMPNWLWERNVLHSIRPGIGDGFLLPYHRLLERSGADPHFDLASCVLHPPASLWNSFSMGSEHVSHDGAVATLVACASIITRIEAALDDWDGAAARAWVDRELNRLWRLRGAFPGLGSALTALGVPNGTLVAHTISAHLGPGGVLPDPWPVFDQITRDPASLLPPELAKRIGETTRKVWASLPAHRRALLTLLARFEITEDQAKRWYDESTRRKAGIAVPDQDILANPYVMFESDREQPDAVAADVIDRGLFTAEPLAAAHPVPIPSACTEPSDARRLRALAIRVLDGAAAEVGHTLLPQQDLVSALNELEVRPSVSVTDDILATVAAELKPLVQRVDLHGVGHGWQLQDYQRTAGIIAERIRRRTAGTPLPGTEDWRALVDAAIGFPSSAAGQTDTDEPNRDDLARQEKAAALQAINGARLSVVIGPAGTGKTTLLRAFLLAKDVREGGVLLLAPTGKARVQLQRRAARDGDTVVAETKTIAQFLLPTGRYLGETRRYRITNVSGDRERGFRTVVIDEASMLTEPQLAATLDGLDMSQVRRIVLVGDPRQLPPIGAGRPFVDIIRYLRGSELEGTGAALAELRTVMRQRGGDDLLLASWFSDEPPPHDAEQVWGRLRAGTAKRIRAVRWQTDGELLAALEIHLKIELRARAGRRLKALEATGTEFRTPETDEDCLETSLGGIPHANGAVYFRPSKDENDVRGAAAFAEAWQILSPQRSGEAGVDGLNRRIQGALKRRSKDWASPPQNKGWTRKTARPLGPQGILYGDKVINVTNDWRRDVWPKDGGSRYLANGEIGIVVGQQKGPMWKGDRLPWKAEIEFHDQRTFKFGFSEREFSDDGSSPLELAYALTIHKSQGSEFGTTFVVVPANTRLLSRELLYTALTRHTDEVVLLHQGEIVDLDRLSREVVSETGRRITNLLEAPRLAYDPSPKSRGFYEEGLIHRSRSGERVRSKGELIIANILSDLGVSYAYEPELGGHDGTTRRPDFVVNDEEIGRLVVIEQLGMMGDPAYRAGWARKLAWYHSSGIRPDSEGGGPNGVLIASDDSNGFDAYNLTARIKAALGITPDL